MVKFRVLALCCVVFVLQSEASTDGASQPQPRLTCDSLCDQVDFGFAGICCGHEYCDCASGSDLPLSCPEDEVFCDLIGVLITGSWSSAAGNTAELYLPSSGESCTLPSLPDSRSRHTVTEGGLLCGGYGPDISDSCLMWSPDSGTWEANVTLDVRREDHVSWTPTSGIGTYLMGGGHSERTTTLVNNDGSQEPGFPLRYNAYFACAIPDPVTDTVVVTGGLFTMTTVVRYGQQGWLEDLPALITGRWDHACSSFMSAGRLMFLVAGGYNDGYHPLDSTETFDPLVGSWTASRAKLPRPMYGLKAENILLFGGYDGSDDHDDILEYDPEDDTITSVGHMIQARGYHAISVVSIADYLQWCDGSL